MIRSRSEYDFVSIDGSVRIDGGIMPLRGGSGVAAKRCLRGEDAAFMLEAAYERAKVCGLSLGNIQKVDSVGRRIHGYANQFAVDVLKRSSDYALNIDAQVATKEVSFNELYDITSAYPGLQFDKSTLVSDKSKFAIGMPLSSDSVMDVFTDISALRAFRRDGVLARSSDSYSETGGGDGWQDIALPAAGGALLAHYAIRQYPELANPAKRWKRSEADAGTLGIEIGDASKYVASAKLAFGIQASQHLNTPSHREEHGAKYGFVVVDAEVADGQVRAGTSSVVVQLKSLVASMFHFYTADELPAPESYLDRDSVQEVFVDVVVAPVALMVLGDHTDFENS